MEEESLLSLLNQHDHDKETYGICPMTRYNGLEKCPNSYRK